MRLLALDQSSKTSGFAVFEDGKLIDYGHFTFTDAELGARLCKIKDKVDSLIDEYNIDTVIYEDIQYQRNVTGGVKTFKALAEVIGVIYELLHRREIPNSAVLSTVWKSVVGIRGLTRDEQKSNAQAYVKETYGLKCTQDESDAICIGTYYFKKNIHEAETSWSK